MDFYAQLFCAPDNSEPSRVLEWVNELNDFLCRPYEAEEIQKALFVMRSNKAPGEDGFTLGFFRVALGSSGSDCSSGNSKFSEWGLNAG
jgi:hypothetical protein